MNRFFRHASERAHFRGEAQAGWAAACAAVLALTLLHAGCARLPKASSGTAARDRLLAEHAAPHGPVRGVGSISVRRADKGGGSARVRWAANAESLAVVVYVGPSRALDASLRGDSLNLVIRHYEMGVAGSLRRGGGVDARLLRFLAMPWDFSAGWVRGALEHATIGESGKGWLLRGKFGQDDAGAGEPPGGDETGFTLELSSRGEPLSLAIRRAGESRDLIRVRYGAGRSYEAARIPSWIEWSFSGSVVTLKVEDLAKADASKIRYASQPEEGWTILALDSPGGRALVRWLLGISEGGAEP